MDHILRFVGRYENNYDSLAPNPEYFVSSTGKKAKVYPPPAGFGGVIFYIMEDMTGPRSIGLVVMVESVKLKTPVKIDKNKHADGKGIGPRGSLIGDDSAINLLHDAIDANPDSRALLISIGNKFFPATSWPLTSDKIEEQNPEVDFRVALLQQKQQIILYGPPGTGKTFSTRSLAVSLLKG